MKLWRADAKQLRPVLVDCPDGLYPHDDAEGRKIFVNTHFATETEAWNQLVAEVSAGVSLAGCDVRQCRQSLDQANSRAASAAVEFEKVSSGYEAWLRAANQHEDDPCDE